MNETILLNPRQKAIITLLSNGNNFSREDISTQLNDIFPASKATLARDLTDLVNLGLVRVEGKGPSTTYQIVSTHPLLKPVDLDYYFAEYNEPNRKPSNFNEEIFSKLSGIYNLTELTVLDDNSRRFSSVVSQVSPTIIERELERFIIELSWKSSKIEGNTYTLLETETLIKQSQEASGRTKEETVMILNHKDAFKTILDNKNSFHQISITLISQLHQTLTKDLHVDTGIRKHAVGITGSTYRPPDNQWQINEFLEQLVTHVNSNRHPIEKAFITLAMISYLQPFTDGNKRTARMLSNAILLAHDYLPLSYRSVDINEYKKAVILFYETTNLFHLKRIFTDQYNYALENYFRI